MSKGPQGQHAALPPRGACGLSAGSDGVGGLFLRPVAALFVRADSIYKTMPGVDAWDIERDARKWPGGCPVVAHPPCTRWSMINGVVLSRYPHKAEEFAWGNDGGTFAYALEMVRKWGGVLEHPAGSRAFSHYGLPRINRGPDRFGGWSCQVRQVDYGHRAEKRTWLYVVGVGPDELPEMPPPGTPTALVVRMPECRAGELMSKAEREHTPPAFAQWLVDLARRVEVLHAPTVHPRESGGILNREVGVSTA
jgi:hypothetical protein